MENLYFDIGSLLINNLLSDTTNFVASYISFIILMVYIFKVLFFEDKYYKIENYNELKTLSILLLLCLLLGISIGFDTYRRNLNMEERLIKSKDELHSLAIKHNTNDKIVLEIAQDIVFCQHSSLKYIEYPSKMIKCENKNYYGERINFSLTKQNLETINTIHENKLFIMQK